MSQKYLEGGGGGGEDASGAQYVLALELMNSVSVCKGIDEFSFCLFHMMQKKQKNIFQRLYT